MRAADAARRGTRTTRSSPKRNSLLSQPSPTSTNEKCATSACCSWSRARTTDVSIVTSAIGFAPVVMMLSHHRIARWMRRRRSWSPEFRPHGRATRRTMPLLSTSHEERSQISRGGHDGCSCSAPWIGSIVGSGYRRRRRTATRMLARSWFGASMIPDRPSSSGGSQAAR